MDHLQNLRTFMAVSRVSGFSEAARQLHVSPSVVVKRVAQLEHAVGAKLFNRTTRVVQLTPAGEQLQRRASAVIDDMDALMRVLRADESALDGVIRLMAPTTLTVTVLGPLINEFMQRHPQIGVEVTLSDRTLNPLETGHDVAITGRAASFPGVVATALCPTSRVACAAPDYLEREGTIHSPQALFEHACIVFRPAGTVWRFRGPKGFLLVDVRPRLVVDDHLSARDAALRGLGVALLPGYVARQALALQQLVEVLDGYALQDEWFTAHTPARAGRQARVIALLDWLASRLEKACVQWPGEPLRSGTVD
jgi:DNA-binding transcriptional LysR family regulator